LEETVAVISALWRDDVASFEGRHLRLSPSQSWPKPVSRPRPPVLLGTRFSERSLERIVAWADGWIPMGPVLGDPAFPDQLGRLRERWEGAGRDPAALQVMALQASRTTESFRRALDRAEELGVQRVAVTMGDDDVDAALTILDRHAAAFAR
jgi:alkanesulfonate monooxygenase SsuD/methylene tetrahydromethanopterin reductase-like flavin-dependent oxidoreductase (luciferase family)